MKELTALIVDDEQLARELVRDHIGRLKHVKVLGESDNGLDALQSILRLEPDVVFMDIQMPGLTGLEIIKKLQSDETPLIIFTTAYDEHAVKAFELNAVDYLLKPIEFERLETAVSRAMERRQTESLLNEKHKILTAMNHMRTQNNEHYEQSSSLADGKLAVSDSGVTNLIPYEDIEWIDAAGDYMCVHANGDTHIIRSTMKELEAKLTPTFFKRIHRSTMVNFNKVTKIEKLTKGEALLYTKAGASLKVSRNYRACLEYWQ